MTQSYALVPVEATGEIQYFGNTSCDDWTRAIKFSPNGGKVSREQYFEAIAAIIRMNPYTGGEPYEYAVVKTVCRSLGLEIAEGE